MELTIQIFEITVEVTFPMPRSFAKDRLDYDALWLTNIAEGFAVTPEQIRLRQGDELFGYDLLAILLGGNGFFFLNAQKANFTAKNARTRGDADLLFQMTARFLKHFAMPEKIEAVFTASAQAKVEDATVREKYFEPFRIDPRIEWPGAAGYLHVEGWAPNVRFQVEAGIGDPTSLFLTWTTKISEDALGKEPNAIFTILESAAAAYGISLKPLN
jgi:hypothetical protein